MYVPVPTRMYILRIMYVRGSVLFKEKSPRPSEHPPVKGKKMSERLGVDHIQRIGCQPEKTTLSHGGQIRSSWSAEQRKENKIKRKSGIAPPPPPPRCSY